MNDIQKSASAFHGNYPNATEEQATQAADNEFAESSDQREFVSFWRKLSNQAAAIRQAKFTSDVDRIWPDHKYG